MFLIKSFFSKVLLFKLTQNEIIFLKVNWCAIILLISAIVDYGNYSLPWAPHYIFPRFRLCTITLFLLLFLQKRLPKMQYKGFIPKVILM